MEFSAYGSRLSKVRLVTILLNFYRNPINVATAFSVEEKSCYHKFSHFQFVRVDHNTDMSTMLELMMYHWDLDKPNLLISVTGGAKNFSMKPRLKEVFRRGLMKAAESTGKIRFIRCKQLLSA